MIPNAIVNSSSYAARYPVFIVLMQAVSNNKLARWSFWFNLEVGSYMHDVLGDCGYKYTHILCMNTARKYITLYALFTIGSWIDR